MNQGVTLTVMVRDDARRLDRCIASLENFVDEVLVLDTGSKDDSVEVARRRGATVEQIVWPDDFSAALNTMLGLVKTAWTLRLDSDEWFDASQAKEIGKYRVAEDVCGYYLTRRDLRPGGIYDEIYVLRLWRTHHLVRYEGIVHEVIRHDNFEAAFPGKRLLRSDTFFWHDGYVADIAPKAERNVRLLELEVERHPDRLEAQAMLATTLKGMGDPRATDLLEKLARRLIDERPTFVPTQAALALSMFMDGLSVEAAQTSEAARLIDLAVSSFPKNPVILYFAAVLERKREDFEESLRYLLQIEALIESRDYDRGISIPSELLNERLWRTMSFVASRLGRQDIIERCNARLGRGRI